MSQTPDIRPADSLDPADGAARSSLRRRANGAPAVRKIRRWPLITLRCLITVFLLLTLVQPVLAGMFITGDVDLLDLHEINALTIGFLSWLLVINTVLLWRPGRGPAWPIGLAVVLAVLVQTQTGTGFSRSLGVHIPLGVALVAVATALTYWAFAYRGGRR
ncbi:hypothetical protein [Streptomyces lunaelactis]|uniref:hypothetical protein n=1 Tax=Streptomyces lunaelactis TaxID=1535768 RepID=UPI00131EFF35|nr:hypothetical protein [Streptomyces lunaelactis]NUK83568.1 hypothetical protein [Streptomyces lunaelactis]